MLHILSLGKIELKHPNGQKSRTQTTASTDKDVEQKEITLLLGIQNGTVTLEDSLVVSNKTYIPYDPAILLLHVYPKELKTYVQTKTYTRMFIISSFIIAKAWKQPRCPSVSEWINKLCYIQDNGILFSAKNK